MDKSVLTLTFSSFQVFYLFWVSFVDWTCVQGFKLESVIQCSFFSVICGHRSSRRAVFAESATPPYKAAGGCSLQKALEAEINKNNNSNYPLLKTLVHYHEHYITVTSVASQADVTFLLKYEAIILTQNKMFRNLHTASFSVTYTCS